ncbi:MAG: helix-turn-helix domain-containing protein [Firmicutes bacterium]|nr:helix-turn-helix domain-containing protein [Bacillota bacterium]
MDYITTKEAAEKWGITERRVQVLCRQGKISGVARLGWAWAIPKDATKPKDHRKTRHKENEEDQE